MKRIDFWLDFISPWDYLAFEQLPRVLEGLSYEVVYRPISLSALRMRHGQPGGHQRAPVDGGTCQHALAQAQALGIPMQLPAVYPFNALALVRLAWGCARQGTPNRYVCEVLFRHVWHADDAVADDAARLAAVTLQLAPALDPASDAVEQALTDATEQALAAGVIDVPSFAVDRRLLSGLHALPALRAQLEADVRLRRG